MPGAAAVYLVPANNSWIIGRQFCRILALHRLGTQFKVLLHLLTARRPIHRLN